VTAAHAKSVFEEPPAGDARDASADAILFTAFEPSGDAHAAPVIRELRRRAPNLRIYAWGGPKMEAAGATMLECTADDGTMGLGALRKVIRFRGYLRAIKRWARQYRVLAHVPVDSPAANFPICKVMHRHGARIVHLVAPQMWAWGRWRVRKLRRLTSLVLCLLPLEEEWFNRRKVPARFVGHESMNRPLDEASLREQTGGLPRGAPRIAIFPGSRSQEVRANLRLLNAVFAELQGRHHGMCGVIVAANPDIAQLVKKIIKVFPTGLHVTVGNAEAAIAWCDLALAVSGTVSLDITRQQKPMIAVYRTGYFSWLMAKLLIRTPWKLLPNIVAGREICPEFIPYVGGPMPIVNAANHLLTDSKNAAIQSEALRRVLLRFSNKRPAEEAATLILKVVKTGQV
jgi:lipid-A-disaccharide synthase